MSCVVKVFNHFFVISNLVFLLKDIPFGSWKYDKISLRRDVAYKTCKNNGSSWECWARVSKEMSGAKEKWSKLLMKTWWSIARQWEVYNRSSHGKQFHELHTRRHVNFCNWWPNYYGITTTFDDECVLPWHCCSEHPLYTSHSLLSSWCLQIEVICKS